jgi:protein-S-isoprenylcysteine O-methyltransferase Ste14
MAKPKRNKKHSWSFVAVQAVILGLLVLLQSDIGPSITSAQTLGKILQAMGWIGILISAYTIRTVLTAEPLPKENGTLSTNGLYKYVRHPMYTSVLLLSFGIAVASGSLLKYLLFALLLVLFIYKSRYEETYLQMQYPAYKKYAKNTPRFIPFTSRKKNV